MRTVLLCPALFDTEGGIERIMRAYLKALCELALPAHEIHLVVLNDGQLPADRLAGYGNAALRRTHTCSRSKIRFTLAAFFACLFSHRVICGHAHLLPVAHIASRIRPRLKAYLVAHGLEVWRTFKPLELGAVRGAHRVLCVSDYTRRQMLEVHPGLRPERMAVLPNALDPYVHDRARVERERGTPVEPGLILTVSRLKQHDGQKGIDHLIEALPRIRRTVPHARLRVIGTGEDVERLRGIRHRWRMEKHVEFTGFVDDSELGRHYASSQLFALPSRKEGFGIVFLEAMAHGKPCLGARAGGIPEVIDETCGVLADYGNVQQIADGCVRLLHAAPPPAALHARCAQFSFEAFSRRLESLL